MYLANGDICSHNMGKRILGVNSFVHGQIRFYSHLLFYSMVISSLLVCPAFLSFPLSAYTLCPLLSHLSVCFADLYSWLHAVVWCLFHLNSVCNTCMLSSSIIICLSYLLPSLWRISTTINNLDCVSCDRQAFHEVSVITTQTCISFAMCRWCRRSLNLRSDSTACLQNH